VQFWGTFMFCKRHIKGKINVVISTVLLDQCYAVSSKNFEHIANLVYTYLIFDNKMAMAVYTHYKLLQLLLIT
jgi:hypothetical protein